MAKAADCVWYYNMYKHGFNVKCVRVAASIKAIECELNV